MRALRARLPPPTHNYTSLPAQVTTLRLCDDADFGCTGVQPPSGAPRRALLRATAVGLCLMATLCAAGGVLLLSVAAQHEASAGGMLKLLKAA